MVFFVRCNFPCNGWNLNNAFMQRSAGNRLFNVVVENADVAQRCIELLTRNKLGRLTFLPLADLRPHTVDQNKVADFHQREGLSGAKKDRVLVPIVEYIEFDPAIQKAIDTIWGKVLIAKDLSVANRGAKFCDAECTTRDGVRVRLSITTTSVLSTSAFIHIQLQHVLTKTRAHPCT